MLAEKPPLDASENLVDAEDLFEKAKKASTKREKLKQTASTKEAETIASQSDSPAQSKRIWRAYHKSC